MQLKALLCLGAAFALAGCKLKIIQPSTASGSGTAQNGSGCPTPVAGAAVAPVYPLNGADWNRYVRNYGSGTGMFDRDDVACAGTETGYFECLHGGELRQFTVTGRSSCTGLTATDELGAFRWVCDSSSGTAVFRSVGLREGKGLRDLVDATAWKSNSVAVSQDGCVVHQTASSAWWSNPVGPPPANADAADSPQSLSTAGQIYVVPASTTTSGYLIFNTDRVALVTLGDAVLSYSGYSSDWCDDGTGNLNVTTYDNSNFIYRSVLCGGGTSKYAWIEGRFSAKAGNNAEQVAYFINLAHSRVHRSEFSGSSPNGGAAFSAGFTLDASTRGNLVSNSAAFGNEGAGLHTYSSTGNTFLGNVSANNGQDGFQIDVSAVGTVLFRNRAYANGHYGIYLNSTGTFVSQFLSFGNDESGMRVNNELNSFQHLTLVSNGSTYDGITMDGGNANSNAFCNVVILNNMDGLWLNNADDNQFTDVLSAHNADEGIEIGESAAANNNLFRGSLTLGGNGSADCTVNLGAGNDLDNACAHTGTTTTGVDAAAALVGKLGQDDADNSTPQVTGSALYSAIDDSALVRSGWYGFESFFRGWIQNGGTSYVTSPRGRCGTGMTCRILDLRTSSGDTDALIKGFYGDFVPGGPCPASIDGTDAETRVQDLQTSSHTYLKSAVELVGDLYLNPNGNHNGLCESGEACLYAPNRGAYQGEGDYSGQTCAPFIDGAGVSGVTLYAYPQNGI
jgi:hypothetical protein